MPSRLERWHIVVAAGVALVLTFAAIAILVTRTQPVRVVAADDPAVQSAENERRSSDAKVVAVTLTAAPTTMRIGDRELETWTFNGQLPGPELRLNAGDVLRARVQNRLPDPLTIHWHGIDLRSDMDGVPHVSQQPIPPGGDFTYEFTVPDPGTFFYHSHVGVQLDRGLYGALIVEDPAAKADYDREFTVILDDWLDGVAATPDDVLSQLRTEGMSHGGMGGMHHGAGAGTVGSPLGTDTGDVDYQLFLSNGRPPDDPDEVAIEPGERVRLRMINAASDTAFRVAVGGAQLEVTHTDGRPVLPVDTDAVLLGMGERYDAVVTVTGPGVFPLVASAEGKDGQAMALLRTGPGESPPPDVEPSELTGRLLTLDDLQADPAVSLGDSEPDRTYRVQLTGGMHSYEWDVDGEEVDGITLPVHEGERVRLVLENDTMMWHPMHLHGQPFQVQVAGGGGPVKDTVNVAPMDQVTVDFVADNPGTWMLHCHNVYHAETGMHTLINYVE
ncbi:MAG TPA: multicopper oxidase family protein [Jiangellaceae bacterium]|nr:multicopper oxidase family protein [Jiangellaceae bacterium]